MRNGFTESRTSRSAKHAQPGSAKDKLAALTSLSLRGVCDLLSAILLVRDSVKAIGAFAR